MTKYCVRCGNAVSDTDLFCSKCGNRFGPPSSPPSPEKPTGSEDIRKSGSISAERGTEVKVAYIMLYIGGIVGIIVGSLAIYSSGFVALFNPLAGGLQMLFGIVFVPLGIAELLAGRWLKNLKRKGGVLGIIIAVILLLNGAAWASMFPMPIGQTIIGSIPQIIVLIMIALAWKRLR